MKKPAQDQSPAENPYGLIGKIYEGAKKDHQSRLLGIYIGGALVIAFLFLASLAPQLGEKLGNLAVKKQTQESLAGGGVTLSFKIIPWPKNYQDLISTLMEQAVNFEKTAALIGARQNRDLAQALQVSGIDLTKPLGYYSAGNVMSMLKIKMNNQGMPEAIWRPLFNSLIRLDQIQKSYLDYTRGGLTKITGQTSTLSWSATNVDSCVASGGWSGQKAISGSQTVSPAQTTTYFLRCSGNTDVVKSVTIAVPVPSPAPTPIPTPTPAPTPTPQPTTSPVSLFIKSITPANVGPYSGDIKIVGSGFGTKEGIIHFTLNGNNVGGVRIRSWNDVVINACDISVPSPNKFYEVKVQTNGGKLSQGYSYYVGPSASISTPLPCPS